MTHNIQTEFKQLGKVDEFQIVQLKILGKSTIIKYSSFALISVLISH